MGGIRRQLPPTEDFINPTYKNVFILVRKGLIETSNFKSQPDFQILFYLDFL